MQIDLTKKQLKTLLELVYLGNWMVNAYRDGSENNPIFEEYGEMAKYICTKAGEEGLSKEVNYDNESKEWFPTRYFEEKSDVAFYHDDYDNSVFWDELSERLSWRDFRKAFSEKEIEQMSFEDRFVKRLPFVEKYEQEFEENRLNRLVIDESKGSEKTSRNEPCTCGSGKKYKKCCGK